MNYKLIFVLLLLSISVSSNSQTKTETEIWIKEKIEGLSFTGDHSFQKKFKVAFNDCSMEITETI